MANTTRSSNPVADELFRNDSEISIETVKMLMLPQDPSVQGLIDEYEQRTEAGESLAIYYVDGAVWMGPR